MVFVFMVNGRIFSRLAVLCFSGMVSVSCISKKNDEVAVQEAAPPPAAYPGSPSEYPGSSDTGTVSSTTAPASPAPAAPSRPAFELRTGEQLVDHQIQSGESLSVIATKYNTSISRIQAANGMSGTKIFAGKTIQVPTSAPPSLAMSSTPSAPTGNAYSSPGGRYGSVASSPAPYSTSPTAPAAPAPSTSAPGAYPSVTAPPVPPAPSTSPSYPSVSAPTAPVPPVPVPPTPSSTSYPPVTAPTPPAAPPTFPTPSFGGGNVQFSQ